MTRYYRDMIYIFVFVCSYLSNWQEFRSISTIAFSLSFVVFTVGVVLAIVRGIINTMAIYLYGDDELDYIMGAHMAAMMLKRLVN